MKIPEHAKRVFKGEIFEVYQWKQEMFDKTYRTFEALKRPPTVEVIATQDERILVCEQEQPNKGPFYSLFSGRGEEGEDPLDTAKRELLEESGYKSEDWIFHKEFGTHHKIEWKMYLYIARNCRKVSEQCLDSGERIKVMLVSFEEFLDFVESPKFWGKHIQNYFFRLRQDEKKLEEFRKLLFP